MELKKKKSEPQRVDGEVLAEIQSKERVKSEHYKPMDLSEF